MIARPTTTVKNHLLITIVRVPNLAACCIWNLLRWLLQCLRKGSRLSGLDTVLIDSLRGSFQCQPQKTPMIGAPWLMVVAQHCIDPIWRTLDDR